MIDANRVTATSRAEYPRLVCPAAVVIDQAAVGNVG